MFYTFKIIIFIILKKKVVKCDYEVLLCPLNVLIQRKILDEHKSKEYNIRKTFFIEFSIQVQFYSELCR